MRLVLLICLLSAPCLAQAGLYRWVDEHGKIHYSAKPPSIKSERTSEEPDEDKEKKSAAKPYTFNRITINHARGGSGNGYSLYEHDASGKRLTHAESVRMAAKRRQAKLAAQKTPSTSASESRPASATPIPQPLTPEQQEALDNRLLCDSARANLNKVVMQHDGQSAFSEDTADTAQRRRALDARKSVEDYCN